MNVIKGYKAFNKDWTCNPGGGAPMQYEVGEEYSIDEPPQICRKGFHFCLQLNDCFSFYDPDPENTVIAEVIALGSCVTDPYSDTSKICTNHIKIVRQVLWDEVLQIIKEQAKNIGDYNIGSNNVGDNNIGDRNQGDHNFGDLNIGFNNVGLRNIGSSNIGHGNKGSFNVGNENFGDVNGGGGNYGLHNFGNCNRGNDNNGNFCVGDHNRTSNAYGCFNTHSQTIWFFNKPSTMSYEEWSHSNTKRLLDTMPHSTNFNTIKDKVNHLSYSDKKRVRPVLKLELDNNKKLVDLWWTDDLSWREKVLIFNLPNFDIDIFIDITGAESARKDYEKYIKDNK